MLVDLRKRDENLTGADAERWLETAGLIVNKNGIPNDPRPPMVTSGLRLGTPALTARGMKQEQMREVAEDVRGVILPWGHQLAEEDPEALAEAYLQFFKE